MFTDYEIYCLIYSLGFESWYHRTGFCYAPTFYFLFYPFHFSFLLYAVIYWLSVSGTILAVVLILYHRPGPVQLVLAGLALYSLWLGLFEYNIDPILAFVLVLLALHRNEKLTRFAIAVMLFKPSLVLAMIVFMLPHLKHRDRLYTDCLVFAVAFTVHYGPLVLSGQLPAFISAVRGVTSILRYKTWGWGYEWFFGFLLALSVQKKAPVQKKKKKWKKWSKYYNMEF